MLTRCFLLMLVLTAAPAVAQRSRPQEPEKAPTDVRLPNGKLQSEEILKAEHEKILEDAAKLAELSEKLRVDIEKNDRHVLSIEVLKQIDEIEKLAKRLRTRIRR